MGYLWLFIGSLMLFVAAGIIAELVSRIRKRKGPPDR